MNTEKIKAGDIFSNYREICRTLNEEIKEGDSKKAQLKEFERYFQYEKHGRKFLILDVYDTPLPKNDKRKDGNRKIYVTYIESILLTYLYRLDNNTGYFTKKQLWRLLGMINQLYGKVNIDDLREYDSNITPWELNKFYQRCDYKLSSILFSSLNSLKNRSLITYEEQYVITKNNKKHIADDEEKKIILEAEKIALSQMGFYSKSHVALCFKLNEFYKNVNSYLNEHYKWKEIYKQYKIIFLDKPYLMEAMNENEILLNKLLLNEKVIDAVNKHAEDLSEAQKEKLDRAYNNALDKLKQEDDIWCEIEPMDKESVRKEYKIFTYPNCFMEVQKMLSQKLLKIDEDNVAD
ncbi:MAG: hypothetical protein HFE79_13345 [Ruminiclostridium sp.]|nr:hypothetical protein [Ruminiclostridium sp.]